MANRFSTDSTEVLFSDYSILLFSHYAQSIRLKKDYGSSINEVNIRDTDATGKSYELDVRVRSGGYSKTTLTIQSQHPSSFVRYTLGEDANFDVPYMPDSTKPNYGYVAGGPYITVESAELFKNDSKPVKVKLNSPEGKRLFAQYTAALQKANELFSTDLALNSKAPGKLWGHDFGKPPQDQVVQRYPNEGEGMLDIAAAQMVEKFKVTDASDIFHENLNSPLTPAEKVIEGLFARNMPPRK